MAERTAANAGSSYGHQRHPFARDGNPLVGVWIIGASASDGPLSPLIPTETPASATMPIGLAAISAEACHGASPFARQLLPLSVRDFALRVRSPNSLPSGHCFSSAGVM